MHFAEEKVKGFPVVKCPDSPHSEAASLCEIEDGLSRTEPTQIVNFNNKAKIS